MSPRPEGATPLGPDAGSPLVYACAADGGPSALGVAAGGADGLFSAAFDDDIDAEGLARAQDEPLLATRREDTPCPMDAGSDGAPQDALTGDESMPTAEPLATPPGQPGDVFMSVGDEVGEVSEAGQGSSPPDASMPDGSGGGGGSAAAPPPVGDAPHAERAPGQKRKEPCYRGPGERGPHSWVSSIQQATRNKATCRDCGYAFQDGEVRVSTLVNARGNRSC